MMTRADVRPTLGISALDDPIVSGGMYLFRNALGEPHDRG